MIIEVIEAIVIIFLYICLHSHRAAIYSMREDILRLNGIIKILQARNGMKADGIDKAG